MLGGPCTEKRGQAHASLRSLGTASPPADFASDHQRANAALRQVIVGRNSRDSDEDKEFG
jgi:hypothetical protein